MSDGEQTDSPNIRGMTPDELNAYAAAYGVADPESYANKDDLIAAIEAVVAPQGETLAEPEAAPDAAEADDGGEPE